RKAASCGKTKTLRSERDRTVAFTTGANGGRRQRGAATQRNMKALQPMLYAMGDRKPSKEELLAAAGKTVPDVIAHGLQLLFCGINPGLYTAAVGHPFARPGNRFWPALLKAGFTDRLLAPSEERELLKRGYGITNLVARATASASELSNEEYMGGARI